MKKCRGLENVSLRIDEELHRRIDGVRGYTSMAEFIRRAIADRVAKLEKKGTKEPGYGGINYDGEVPTARYR